MTPSKRDPSPKKQDNPLTEVRKALHDLKEISRWQFGLVSRLEQTVEQLQTDQRGKPPTGK